MTDIAVGLDLGTGTADAKPEDVLIADKVAGLDMILAREPYFTPRDIFADPAMHILLAWARARYQTIVLDLPPILGVADARTLAKLADAVTLIVKWGDTPIQAIDLALSSLRSDDSRIAGAIYTMVNPAAEAIGGTYYSSDYTNYYQRA